MDRRVLKTKAAINRAYFKLLMDREGEKITVTDIARRADIDRKTFYLHYNSPEDVLKEFIQDKIDSYASLISENGFQESPIPTVRAFKALNAVFERDLPLYRTLASGKTKDAFWRHVDSIIKESTRYLFTSVIGIDEKHFDLHTVFFANGILAVYRAWINDELNIPLDDIAVMLGEISDGSLTAITKIIDEQK